MKLVRADCLSYLPKIETNSIDAIVTDPPYELGFMGKAWDKTGIAYNIEVWKECLRVLKPGGYLLAFGGSRTYHRMACAIEDAGFEVRDQIFWVYSQGFPKSLSLSKQLSKQTGIGLCTCKEHEPMIELGYEKNNKHRDNISNGDNDGLGSGEQIWSQGNDDNEVAKQNENTNISSNSTIRKESENDRKIKEWKIDDRFICPKCRKIKSDIGGTALKPAHEPICMARKPLSEKTIAENVLKWGTGALNIDACRIPINTEQDDIHAKNPHTVGTIGENDIYGKGKPVLYEINKQGRFPANVIHDGSDEVMAEFAKAGMYKAKKGRSGKKGGSGFGFFDDEKSKNTDGIWPEDCGGSAARFFYCAKSSQSERNAGLEDFEEQTKVWNGQADKSSTEIKPVEQRFTTKTKNIHPTVKPIKLMEYLIKLVAREGQTVLDPFMGSGSTGIAAKNLKRNFVGIEISKEYYEIAKARLGIKPKGEPK